MYNGVLIADGVGKDFILPKIAGFRIPKWRPHAKKQICVMVPPGCHYRLQQKFRACAYMHVYIEEILVSNCNN